MRIIKTLRSNSKKIKIYNRELFLKIKKINNISILINKNKEFIYF